jgi:hypothetical protein
VTARWRTLPDLVTVDGERTIVLEMLLVTQVPRPLKIMIPDMVDDEKEGALDTSYPSVADDSCVAYVRDGSLMYR